MVGKRDEAVASAVEGFGSGRVSAMAGMGRRVADA